jgi:hypothetical protein
MRPVLVRSDGALSNRIAMCMTAKTGAVLIQPVAATLLIALAVVAGIIVWVKPLSDVYDAERHERWVTLCMRAYDFSRDRCEFIRLNGGRDLQ